MNKIKEMEARKKDARLKALAILEKAQAEGRFLTEEEEKQVRQFEEEMKRWDDTIARTRALMEEEEQPEERDMEPARHNPKAAVALGEQRFASLGEQMLAVYRAAAPDGRIDPRLTTRAASGLSESVSSDGGFLVQQDFVTELLKRTYERGFLLQESARFRFPPMLTG